MLNSQKNFFFFEIQEICIQRSICYPAYRGFLNLICIFFQLCWSPYTNFLNFKYFFFLWVQHFRYLATYTAGGRCCFPWKKPISRHILWFTKGFFSPQKHKGCFWRENLRNTLCVSFRFPIDKFFAFLKIYLFETW